LGSWKVLTGGRGVSRLRGTNNPVILAAPLGGVNPGPLADGRIDRIYRCHCERPEGAKQSPPLGKNKEIASSLRSSQ
jgi:hypothetical protein